MCEAEEEVELEVGFMSTWALADCRLQRQVSQLELCIFRLLLLVVVSTLGDAARHLNVNAELGRAARARVELQVDGATVLVACVECGESSEDNDNDEVEEEELLLLVDASATAACAPSRRRASRHGSWPPWTCATPLTSETKCAL